MNEVFLELAQSFRPIPREMGTVLTFALRHLVLDRLGEGTFPRDVFGFVMLAQRTRVLVNSAIDNGLSYSGIKLRAEKRGPNICVSPRDADGTFVARKHSL